MYVYTHMYHICFTYACKLQLQLTAHSLKLTDILWCTPQTYMLGLPISGIYGAGSTGAGQHPPRVFTEQGAACRGCMLASRVWWSSPADSLCLRLRLRALVLALDGELEGRAGACGTMTAGMLRSCTGRSPAGMATSGLRGCSRR